LTRSGYDPGLTIVKAQQAEHGQEEPHTQTDASTELEGIVGRIIIPAIGRLEESQPINGAAGVGDERITQFERVFVEHRKELGSLLLIRVDLGIGILEDGIAALRNDIIPSNPKLFVRPASPN
jgi:hypothetical protein